MRNFEPFTGRAAPVVTEPAVTVQAKGTLSVNRAAAEALGYPQRVELLFDRGARVIGLRPADASVRHSYPLRKQQKSSSYVLAATAFTQAYGIPTDRARRFSAVLEDGILVIDLNGPSIDVSAPRDQRKSSRADVAAVA